MKKLKLLFCLSFYLLLCVSNVWGEGEYTWDSSTKTLTIHKAGAFASGVMTDYTDVTQRPWNEEVSTTPQHLIVDDGITHLGHGTFYKYENAEDVQLPSSLTSIGHGAFFQCYSLSEVHFKGSPDEWASIDFQSNNEQRSSHPFYASTSGAAGYSIVANRKFAFYYTSGSAPNSVDLIMTSKISEIKPYAFYKATNVSDVYIQGTVTTIGSYSLDCAITRLYINKKVAPSTGTNAISWKTETSTYLYVPEGATASYKTTPFYYGTSASSTGARYIGYSGDQVSIKASGIGDTGTTYKISGSFDNITWSLDTTGTLLLCGYGAISKSYAGEPGSADCLPWARFRRLVNKAVIRPNGSHITNINTILRYCYSLKSIVLEQATIPTSGSIGGQETPFANLFDQRKNVSLQIPQAALTAASASNLASAPWNNAKLDIELSEGLTIDENGTNNNTLLANCSTYIEKPVDITLTRSLSNAYYNTFCSPVDMTAEEVTALFGGETELVEFDGTEIINDTLRLKFKTPDGGNIAAGNPYLIKPENNVANPTFTDIDPAAIATSGNTINGTHATFNGTLAPVAVTSEQIDKKNFIFLLADNQLTYATDGTLKGMRAYFLLKDSAPASILAHRPVLKIGSEQNTATAVQIVTDKETEKNKKVMQNGQLMIVHNGQIYDIYGRIIH